MITLNSSPIGKCLKIKWILGKSSEVEDIRSMGIKEGQNVTVLNSIAGNVIVAIDNLRYAISEDVACRIKVG